CPQTVPEGTIRSGQECPRSNKNARLRRASRYTENTLRPVKFLFCDDGFFLPDAPGSLGHQPFLQRADSHAHIADLAVADGLDALEVREEPALGNGGNVGADATLFLGLAAAPNDAALHRALAG